MQYPFEEEEAQITELIMDEDYIGEFDATLLEDENQTENPEFPKFNESTKFGHVNLELGMLFTNLQSFKTAVKDYNIHLGREIKWMKNDKTRVRSKCKQHQCCNWEIYCSWSEMHKCFQIKTFVSEHTCDRVLKNKQVDKNWIVEKLEEKIRMKPGFSRREAHEYFKEEFGEDIHDSRIFRALKSVRELVFGRSKKRRRDEGNEESANVVDNDKLARKFKRPVKVAKPQVDAAQDNGAQVPQPVQRVTKTKKAKLVARKPDLNKVRRSARIFGGTFKRDGPGCDEAAPIVISDNDDSDGYLTQEVNPKDGTCLGIVRKLP